ncbi:1606_t:CDS:2 [Paraglomus occultum]|uniref:1606_t:CDS:1 n=1 Tax=Paraglomus occultum TaxID=144539 RepID=A0A9N9BVF5_9GLOM|nr:1606_t:CDS:2 [Paraglomus occultum]
MIKKLSGQYSDIFSEVKEQYPSIISDKLFSNLKEETKSVEDFVKAEENYQKSPSDNGNDNSGNGTNNKGNSNNNGNSNGSNGGGNTPSSSNNSELEEKIKDLQNQLSTVKKELGKKQQQNPNSSDSLQEERKKDELERELERLNREKENNKKTGRQNPQKQQEAKRSKVSSFKIKHMTNKNQKQKSFKEYLQEIEDPKNNSEINYALPENPTPLQVAKFEICQEILGYKLDNDLTREQVAEKIGISKAETEDILFCHIEEFTLDRLVDYASKLLDPIQHFSKEDNEWQWTYEIKIIFNKNHIIAITITDHYQKHPGREQITNELILELLKKLNG